MAWVADEFTGRRIGRYEVLCRLAVGGMSELFLAFARGGAHAGRAVVLKRMIADQRDDRAAMAMVLNEAKLTAALSHPNLAQVLDLEQTPAGLMMVIEFIDGANLEELMAQRDTELPLGFALSMALDVATGLEHAHSHRNANGKPQPVVHRDVSPRNVMVGFDGVARLVDLGIARVVGSQRGTQAGMVRGTSAYMSPEQAVGEPLDARSDIFSLGVVLHEVLTGKPLFRRHTPLDEMKAVYDSQIRAPSSVSSRVPHALDVIVLKALARKREARYSSAGELAHDLRLAIKGTQWSHSRCGRLMQERFATRRSALRRLLTRLPELDASQQTRVDIEPAEEDDVSDETVIGFPSLDPPRPAYKAPPRPQRARKSRDRATLWVVGSISLVLGLLLGAVVYWVSTGLK